MSTELTFAPLTTARWGDFETLLGTRGGCGGCWCRLHRVARKVWEADKGAANKAAMAALVAGGTVPGLIAYGGGRPLGWCSFGPRSDFPGLARSRIMAPVDGLAAWSISCFFVARPHRRQGVSVALLHAAADWAAAEGAPALDGYPIDPGDAPAVDVFAWTGIAAAFRQAGFAELARRSPTRPVMRRLLNGAARDHA